VEIGQPAFGDAPRRAAAVRGLDHPHGGGERGLRRWVTGGEQLVGAVEAHLELLGDLAGAQVRRQLPETRSGRSAPGASRNRPVFVEPQRLVRRVDVKRTDDRVTPCGSTHGTRRSSVLLAPSLAPSPPDPNARYAPTPVRTSRSTAARRTRGESAGRSSCCGFVRVAGAWQVLAGRTPRGRALGVLGFLPLAMCQPAEGARGDSARIVCQESQVILRIATVMASPISGSAISSPSATPVAPATTARLT
jgi:hypothetical protein